MKALLGIILISTAALAEVPKPIPDFEDTRELDGTSEVVNLREIENRGLLNASTSIDLWSGSYWPQYQGSLGVRYREPQVAALISAEAQYKEFKELAQRMPLYSYYGRENNLSPAEKYDLVVGDPAMGLTAYSWALGKKTGGESGKVPIWRGICDGFASASQVMPRPTKSVVLSTPSGTPITFYPEDIKALGSLSYARSQRNTIFIGKRCLSGALFFTAACDETNPGTFHKALVNRVGKLKKSFVADISPGSEVWNYPVKNYSIVYFNVFTEQESTNYADVAELFNKKAKFKKVNSRHKRTAYIVGAKVEVNYTDMRVANLLETDSRAQDKVLEMEYVYDLELDAYGNILGGESISGNLPDFIWAPNDETYPLSDAEIAGNGSLLQKAQAASKVGQPLASIVQKLFEQAR